MNTSDRYIQGWMTHMVSGVPNWPTAISPVNIKKYQNSGSPVDG